MYQKIKIIVAEDHHLVRKGFVALLNEMPDIEVVGEATNGYEVINLLKKGTKPDLVLLDYEMPVMNGLDTLQQIKKDFFGVKVILITMIQDKGMVEKCISHGVEGFLFKNASYEELHLAIQKISFGEKYFTPDVVMLLASKTNSFNASNYKLTDRELEIIKLVAEGKTSPDIAASLYISTRTVETHRNNIMQKLELDSVVALVKWAMKNKIID